MELESLRLPEDLHRLQLEELESLAEEIRNRIVSVCLKNGGHLGASLGAVELAIALHRVFESPKDRIFWDVGHQAYAHKLLTGRVGEFASLRTSGGISGFLSREESVHDAFGAGHSSTSLSAALGSSYDNPNWSVAVIGDGALTAGVALEALLQFKLLPKRGPLLVILNDNQMSISRNVGVLPEILRGGDAGAYFEQFGFEYVGPVDGHQLSILLPVINGIRTATGNDRPVLLHVHTQKGRGYLPAEDRPETFHGVSPTTAKKASDKTEPQAGEKPSKVQSSWSNVFGRCLQRAAEKDSDVVAITAAMSEGTGLSSFFQAYPERSFDVGIAEPHAVTFAAGLAAAGKKPVVAIYSTFLQRAIDPMIHDVALQKLNVLFAVDRAGLVGADGPTHHGTFDLVYASMIPGFQVFVPQTEEDFEALFDRALKVPGPKLIRYPRGTAESTGKATDRETIERGYRTSGAPFDRAKKIAVSIGPVGTRINRLIEAKSVSEITHVSLLQASPLPKELLEDLSRFAANTPVYFYEEGIQRGSVSEGIAAHARLKAHFRCIPNEFVPHGSPLELERKMGWDDLSILRDLRVE